MRVLVGVSSGLVSPPTGIQDAFAALRLAALPRSSSRRREGRQHRGPGPTPLPSIHGQGQNSAEGPQLTAGDWEVHPTVRTTITSGAREPCFTHINARYSLLQSKINFGNRGRDYQQGSPVAQSLKGQGVGFSPWPSRRKQPCQDLGVALGNSCRTSALQNGRGMRFCCCNP